MRSDLSASGVLAVLGLGCAVGAELLDAPSAGNFVRRDAARATVLGDYVYVDGGELSQLVDGKISSYRSSNQVNSTLSIDISKSWTASDLVIRTIPRPSPAKANVALWTDTAAGVFYSWGGKYPFGLKMVKDALWKFTPDGSGGGAWSKEEPTNPTLFTALHPSEQGVSAYTNDTGILIGGLATGWTELYRGHTQTLPGMVTFNMKTKVWQNGTTGFSPFPTLVGASAHYVPSFGLHGLVLVFGGHTPPVVGLPDLPTAPFVDLRNLTLFDPETKERYWQMATGSIPPTPRSFFCVTGCQNPAGGYEIFLFGGQNQRDKFNYDDAYILSLPGFVWTKLPDTPAGRRRGATCVPVGKRQVLTIGGIDDDWRSADPAPQGLQLFDMTALKWTDAYDANAAAYEQADVIKRWYSSGSLAKVEWSSDEVRKLFATQTTNSARPTPDATDGSGAATNSGGTESRTDSGSGSTPVGAIAGGVVGGLAGLAAIAVVAWLVMRRRNPRTYAPPSGADETRPSNTDGGANPASELHASEQYDSGYYTQAPHPPSAGAPEMVELHTSSEHSELHGSPFADTRPHARPAEMDGKPVAPLWSTVQEWPARRQ